MLMKRLASLAGCLSAYYLFQTVHNTVFYTRQLHSKAIMHMSFTVTFYLTWCHGFFFLNLEQ
jgi:hypothetical protein